MITYQFAKSDDGTSKDINDVSVEYRSQHEFTCYGCGCRMIARLKDDKKERHFAHYKEGICSRETYLHQLGKNMFVELFEFNRSHNIPLSVEFTQRCICNVKDCPLGVENPCEKSLDTGKFFLLPNFPVCLVEQYDKATGLRPDILLTNEKGKKVYVEIVVTHETTQKKYDTGIPIIEFSFFNEGDLECFKRKQNSVITGFLSSCVSCFNMPDLYAPVDTFCIEKIARAKAMFKNFYELKVAHDKPLNIALQYPQKCMKDNCPYQLSTRCSKDTEKENIFNLTERFKTIVDADEEKISPNLYLEDGKGTRIRINFTFENAKINPFDKQERIIQFILDSNSTCYPWNRQEILRKSWDIRFYKFKEPNFPECTEIYFRSIVLYKNGYLADSGKGLNIEQIKHKFEEIKDDIYEYILLSDDFQKKYSSKDEHFLLRTAVRLYQKYNYLVKNCFVCAYCRNRTALASENGGSFYCYKYKKNCSYKDYPGCEYFTYDRNCLFEGFHALLPVADMEKEAFTNRMKFIDIFLEKQNGVEQ